MNTTQTCFALIVAACSVVSSCSSNNAKDASGDNEYDEGNGDSVDVILDSDDEEYDCNPLAAIGDEDFDGDGIPNSDDTDDDNDDVEDIIEHIIDDCVLQDYDGDGNPDGYDTDSDGDQICDGYEMHVRTNRLATDSDMDTLPDWMEIRLGTNPIEETPRPVDGIDVQLSLLMSAWSLSSCCTERKESVVIDLDILVASAYAEIGIADILVAIGSKYGAEFIDIYRIQELIPPDGGHIIDDTTMSDIQEGTTVRIEIENGWPDTHPIEPCDLIYLTEIHIKDDTDEIISTTISMISLPCSALVCALVCA